MILDTKIKILEKKKKTVRLKGLSDWQVNDIIHIYVNLAEANCGYMTWLIFHNLTQNKKHGDYISQCLSKITDNFTYEILK